MKQRIITITLAAVLSALCTFGQTFSSGSSISRLLRGMDRKDGNKVGLSRSEGKPMVRSYVENLDIHTADRWTADTVYFEEVERRTSWIVGKSEPLSKQSLRLGKTYFMLTRKNSTGHYLRVELTDTLGTTPPVMQNLFAELLYDYNFTPEYVKAQEWWFEKGRKIHRTDFTPSADGRHIVAETAYLSDGMIAHRMTHELTSENRAIAFYFTSMRMAVMTDESYRQPTGMIIDYKPDGTYKTLTPIDADGWPIARK